MDTVTQPSTILFIAAGIMFCMSVWLASFEFDESSPRNQDVARARLTATFVVVMAVYVRLTLGW